MEHTYLRYECADSFGLTVASASSKGPPSNAILGVIGRDKNSNLLLTTTGSCVTGFHLKQAQPVIKVGHRDTARIGTGRALNSDEVVCLDVLARVETATTKIATGWVDGSVRIFDLHDDEIKAPAKLANSLILDDERNELLQQEPLLLNGQNGSPVRSVVFDRSTNSRLASGGSDGTVVLWDIVAETGLFRLLGHRGGITDISFLHLPVQKFDGMISCSLDGLVKVWDLNAQCCTQTIASHRGEVWAGACMPIVRQEGDEEEEQQQRWRLITGGNDGQVRVWSVEPATSPSKTSTDEMVSDQGDQGDIMVVEEEEERGQRMTTAVVTKTSPDDICHFMGTLLPPPNVSVSNEKLSCIHYHPSGRFLGVLHANSKNVDIYLIRGVQESRKKRQRRLKRRQEKQKRKRGHDNDDGDDDEAKRKGSGQKRGILDDPESSDEEDVKAPRATAADDIGITMDPELLKASDEFEYIGTARCGHKVRGFSFVPSSKEKRELTRVVCALSTNALETHCLVRKKEGDKGQSIVVAEKLNTMDFYGHPTGIRSIAISSDDRLACTVSKNVTKIWNVASRTCIQSLAPAVESSAGGKKSKASSYGLCAAFLPGSSHVAVGTREGHLLLIDIAAGEIVYTEENAHDGAIWSLDIRSLTSAESAMALVTGSADKCVKFWTIEAQEDSDDDEGEAGSQPMFVQTRTLQMSDDVIAVAYSKGLDPTKRMVFVSTLDCTIKVFFDDSLKLFLSLYGHKLPALAVNCSDDDVLLASGGADKTIKIWGLDFGDTHRTLHGHEDSVTDIKFVRRTHNFFSSSKDGTVRYWDGDRHEQILLLNGHCAEVNCLAVSRTGAFVLSGGMDRQVRVWERTKDIVFLEEERERELEKIFDQVNDRNEGGTASILDGKRGDDDDDDEDVAKDDEPQSEAAVRKSVLSVSAGDRIMEALERADNETKAITLFVRTHGSDKKRPPNLLMLGHSPSAYILWVLRTIKSADLEQSLIVLPLGHIERLLYYIIVLLKRGQGIELCSRVAIFLIKTHQNQIVANGSMAPPLRELRRLIRIRLAEARDVVGFDLAALKLISKVANDRKQFLTSEHAQPTDIWAGLGLGSDVAAALEGRSKKA